MSSKGTPERGTEKVLGVYRRWLLHVLFEDQQHPDGQGQGPALETDLQLEEAEVSAEQQAESVLQAFEHLHLPFHLLNMQFPLLAQGAWLFFDTPSPEP